MRWSRYYLYTTREDPGDAEVVIAGDAKSHSTRDVIRAIGGILFLVGSLIMVYNLIMTVRAVREVEVAEPRSPLVAAQ